MVIVWEAGSGLGNRLFISAYGIALARATGQRLVNLHLDKFEDLFPATSSLAWLGRPRLFAYKILRAIIRRLKRIEAFRQCFVSFSFDGGNSAHYSPDNPIFIEEVRRRRLTIIEGWPFLEKMGFPSVDAIRQTFVPYAPVLAEVASCINAAKKEKKSDVLVGVHIRWGDYKHHLNGKYYYAVEDYRRVMERIADLLEPLKVSFLVCSNESRDIDAYASLNVAFGPGTLLGDLYSLAACDYLIGPPSTFSLWASFYGKVPFFCMMTPEPPKNISNFVVPDGRFECMQTIMDIELR